MKAEELRPVMMSRVKDVTEVLGVPATAAMVLLRTHNFSKEHLLEDYMQAPEKILKRAGVFSLRKCRRRPKVQRLRHLLR